MKCTRINPNLLDPSIIEASMEARWRRKQHQIWASATAQKNDLEAAGIAVSHSTVCNWRSGLIPHHFTLMRIAAAGWRALVMYVQAPAMEAGEIASLEREIEEQEQRIRIARRELEARVAALGPVGITGGHAPNVEAQ